MALLVLVTSSAVNADVIVVEELLPPPVLPGLIAAVISKFLKGFNAVVVDLDDTLGFWRLLGVDDCIIIGTGMGGVVVGVVVDKFPLEFVSVRLETILEERVIVEELPPPVPPRLIAAVVPEFPKGFNAVVVDLADTLEL